MSLFSGANASSGSQRGPLFGSGVDDGAGFSRTASIPDERGSASKGRRKPKADSKLQITDRRSSDSTNPSDQVLYSLISLQTFAGFWELSDEIVSILVIPREKLGLLENRIIGDKEDSAEDNQNLWVTLLVVRFLEIYMQEEKDVWELVVDKARAWLGDRKLGEGVAEEIDRVLTEVKG